MNKSKTENKFGQAGSILLIKIFGILFVTFTIGFSIAGTLVSASSNVEGIGIYQDLDPSKIKVTFLNQDPDPAEPGEIVETRWKIENYGAGNIGNMEVTLDPEYPFSFVPGEEKTKNLGTVEARQIGRTSYTISWKLKVDTNAPEGDYNIPFDYNIGSVKVKGEDANIKVKVRESLIIVDSIEVTPKKPKAGEEAELKIILKNLADSTIDNVQVKLNLDSANFVTIGSTSEKAFKKMMPKETIEMTYNLAINANTPSKVHNIPLIIEFNDFENKKYALTNNFGLLIENPAEYTVNLDETAIYKNRQKGKVIISFSNIGKSDINFVTMELLDSEDYETLSTKKVYIGNLESDDYESAEFEIYSNSRKKIIPLLVKLEYKDSFNKNHEKNIEVPLKIYSVLEAKKYGLTTGGNAGFVIFMLIIAFAAMWVYKARKKTTFRKLILDILHWIIKILSGNKPDKTE